MNEPVKPGDVITLISGEAPYEVTDVNIDGTINAIPLDSRRTRVSTWFPKGSTTPVTAKPGLPWLSGEPVNHPAHYGGDTPHETVKCLKAWGLESDALLWNAVKYILRAGKKGDALEDLKKALYSRRVVRILEKWLRKYDDGSGRRMVGRGSGRASADGRRRQPITIE